MMKKAEQRWMAWGVAAVMAMTPWVHARALTRYVSLDGTNDAAGGYTNWPGAATAIQAAIDACDDGDVILVSNGTYGVDSGNQVASIAKSLTMRGVYGREATIINGSNTRHCILIYQTNNLPIDISGFTLTEGRSLISNRGGGGIRVESLGEVRLTDCIISNNTTAEYNGAGVYHARGASTLILSNCLVIGNTSSTSGGGIYTDTTVQMLEMYDCQVLNNTAATNGGGIFAQGPIRLENCVISSNSASIGGGLHNWAKLTIVNRCIFEGNDASGGGAGIFIRNSAPQSFVSNCIIRGNTSPYASDRVGAGIKYEATGGRLVGCLIEGNTASASYGGGLVLGLIASVWCENLTIVSNSAPRGGGLYFVSSSPCTILNSIICDNKGTNSNIYINGAGLLTFTNCCTAPLSAVVGDGNIDSDPLFVDPAAGRYQLQSQSPCVNTGANQPWMAEALDLDCHERLDRFSRIVDMGCYEYVYRGSIFQLR